MKKSKGYHFYVNIKNLNQIMIDEEAKTGEVNHTLHALDTYFSSIESYGKRKYPNVFFVEKITGSRLHMYVIDDFKIAYPIVNDISVYAFILANYLNKEIYRYKSLLDFKIQVGSSYGEFYNFMFQTENYIEETTIGYVANFSAKLQSLAKEGHIAISLNVYESMNSYLKRHFTKTIDESLIKYNQTCYYSADLRRFATDHEYNNELELAKKKSNEVTLNDINFRKAYTKISFDSLSKKECKDILGIPLFADIRGFTQKFEEDDSNLEEMSCITKDVLSTMYLIVREKGIHVQFQGDREFALFHNYGEYDCCRDAVITGLKLIDAIRTKDYFVTIGVGQSIGRMFVSKIGARGEKDNIVLGETVTIADQNEDKYAKENQLVISEEIYTILKYTQTSLAKLFKKEKDYYKTEVGYKEFCDVVSYEHLKMNNKRNNYNGAWAE